MVAGMSAAGSPWAGEPPIVPLLRTAGSPIIAAVSDTTAHFAFSTFDDSTSQCVVIAPIEIMPLSSLIPVRPGTLRRSIRCLGCARRSFIIGIRLWPPARILASSSLPRSFSASATLAGAWYSNAAGYMGASPLAAGLRGLDGLPHTLGRERHRLDMVDAERAQRVDDGIHDRGRGGDGSGLTRALDSERIHGRRRHRTLRLVHREHVGLGQRVFHHRARHQLAAAVVVDGALPERLADTLRDAAVNHAVDDHRVDHVAH